MKKIKASEILTMNKSLTIEELRNFKFFAVDRVGDKCIYWAKPNKSTSCWIDGKYFQVVETSFNRVHLSKEEWENSLREIDFTNSEPESSQEVESVIKQTSDWLMRNTKLDVTVIVDLSEYLRKINL